MTPPKKESEVRYQIVGQKHKGRDPFLTGILAGVPALLVREPNNPADANAVAVYIDGQPVGYIPKKDNAALARRIDAEGESWRAACLKAGLGFDAQAQPIETKTLHATFVRSHNSSYPQVELPDG